MGILDAPAFRAPAGVSLPPTWGQFYLPKLAAAKAGTGLCRVALVTDSLGHFDSSSPASASWIARLKTALQTLGGDGGSGFKNVSMTSTFLTLKGLTAFTTSWSSWLMTVTGSWVFGFGFGAAGGLLQSGTNTSTLTDTVRGRYVKIVYWDSTAAFSYQIDAGTVVTGQGGTNTRMVKTITVDTGSGSVTHTVKVTATGHTGTGSASVSICGFAGENATGVVVNDFSQYGSKVSDMNNTDGSTLVTLNELNTKPGGGGTASGGWQYPADLVIFQRGVNDANSLAAADTTMGYLRDYLKGVLDTTYSSLGATSPQGQTDVLLLHTPVPLDSGTTLWFSYLDRFRGMAAMYGLADLNLQPMSRGSRAYWIAQGYYGDPATPGAAGNGLVDALHYSDAGHLAIYNEIIAKFPKLLAA